MNHHDSIKSNRPGKHAAAKRDQQAHTPGPWTHHHNITESHGVWSKVGLVASVNAMQAGWMANATLIAAAPEMLACLGYAEDFVSLLIADGRDNGPANYALAKIRAMIAKATGGCQ